MHFQYISPLEVNTTCVTYLVEIMGEPEPKKVVVVSRNKFDQSSNLLPDTESRHTNFLRDMGMRLNLYITAQYQGTRYLVFYANPRYLHMPG